MLQPKTPQSEDGFWIAKPISEDERWRGILAWRSLHPQLAIYDQEHFTVREVNRRFFLIFEFGKRAARWTHSIFLGDRFPPFDAVVQKWSKAKALQELTRPQYAQDCPSYGLAPLLDDFRRDRDRVLIAELVRRRLDAREFQKVMDSKNGRLLLIAQLESDGQTTRYTDSILAAIHRYESFPDVNQRVYPQTKANIVWSHLAELIRALPREHGPDFSKKILELAATGKEADVGIGYVHDRMIYAHTQFDYPHSRELAEKLAVVDVPEFSRIQRDFVVSWIRHRPTN